MGKDKGEGELWDDSALISALDDAMSKYKVKKMHGKMNHQIPSEAGQVIIPGIDGSISVSTEGNPVVDGSVMASGAVTEAKETGNILSANGEASTVTSLHGSYPASSDFMPANGAINGYSYSQSAEDYNQLLAEYYELEDKRGKLLEKLHQYGNRDYQSEPSGYDPGVQQLQCAHPSQESPGRVSHSVDACACCPYFCQTFVSPCPASTCSFGGTCGEQNVANAPSSDTRESLPLEECDITKTAIEAAWKAISSLKIEASSLSEVKEKKEAAEMAGTRSAETDLTNVLNAWYSAGFYTGKYLVEKSIREKRQS